MAAALAAQSGCSSLHGSIPATQVSPSVLDMCRSNQQTINYTELRLNPPKDYRLGPRDILTVYVEGALGSRDALPPINIPQQENLPPATGYPIPVRDDGTISLPLISAVPVEGLTVSEAEDKIREAYTVPKQILPEGRARVMVSLMRKRTYHVLVIRGDQEPRPASYSPGQVLAEPLKAGFARALELPAYENDVLHALVQTGGLPGTTAKDEVIVYRNVFRDQAELRKFVDQFQDPARRSNAVAEVPVITRIPLRHPAGETGAAIPVEDIVLGDGDVVTIESRDSEVFYTGGLLRGGQFVLPRDYDLDVLGAIAMAGGSIGSAAGGTATSAGVTVGRAAGVLPPTTVIVLRTQNGRQTTIRVNLKRVMQNPEERVLIQPNDFIVLQYTTAELWTNYALGSAFLSFSGPLWK